MSVAVLADRLEIALTDLNFEWSLVQMRQVVDYWYDGKSIYDMAELLNRKPDEIILLIVDFARGRVLPPRPYGLNANKRISIKRTHLKGKKDNLRRFVQDSPVYIPFIEKTLSGMIRRLSGSVKCGKPMNLLSVFQSSLIET